MTHHQEHINLLPEDVMKRNVHKVPRVMLYGAGPPCQGVSSAGKKKGMVSLLNMLGSGIKL